MDEREQFERNFECTRKFFGPRLDEPVVQWPENSSAIVLVVGPVSQDSPEAPPPAGRAIG